MSSNVIFKWYRIERAHLVGTPNGIDRMVGDRFGTFHPSQNSRLTDWRGSIGVYLEWMIQTPEFSRRKRPAVYVAPNIEPTAWWKRSKGTSGLTETGIFESRRAVSSDCINRMNP